MNIPQMLLECIEANQQSKVPNKYFLLYFKDLDNELYAVDVKEPIAGYMRIMEINPNNVLIGCVTASNDYMNRDIREACKRVRELRQSFELHKH